MLEKYSYRKIIMHLIRKKWLNNESPTTGIKETMKNIREYIFESTENLIE